jgi:hypothetical protein
MVMMDLRALEVKLRVERAAPYCSGSSLFGVNTVLSPRGTLDAWKESGSVAEKG